MDITNVLVCKSLGEAEVWYKKLKKYCVQSDFHKDYRTAGVLGKGSFAKVYDAYKKIKYKRVAIKSMRKSHLMKDKFVAVSFTLSTLA